MNLKLFLNILAMALGVFCYFVKSEEELRTKSGWKKIYELIEAGGLKIGNWRANANIKQEITDITKFAKKRVILCFILLIVAAKFHLDWIGIFITPFLFFYFLTFTSLECTMKHRAVLKYFFGMFLLTIVCFFISPYLALSGDNDILLFLLLRLGKLLGMTIAPINSIMIIALWAVFYILLYSLITLTSVAISFSIVMALWLTAKLSLSVKAMFNRELLKDIANAILLGIIVLGFIINLL